MAGRISLCLVLHNHQPVGNFGWVIEEVYRLAYEPLIGALERHPTIRLGLHYSGPLLEWLESEQPQFLERLSALIASGQVEILGGAHFEPILVALPRRDRHGQLTRMRDDVVRRFGVKPAGAWLAERVWEPSLAYDLAAAGYRYTVLDDNHLRSASVPEDEMWGTYTTDDQGRLLTIFGTEKGLRYRIPWRPADELIDYLRLNAREDGHRLGTMGDDGEKFGAWPGTHELSWGKGRWVDDCFDALAANAEWLTTIKPTDWLEREAPVGRVYVPTASYVEMTQWALPADEANVFEQLVARAVEEGSPAVRFLRGGLWRNFQARYREINDLHKQMLRASAAVEAMPAGPDRERALNHLYRGQSNDCYWHGLFGGVYLPHMRLATHAELIAAQDLAAGRDAPAASGVADYDLDGIDEVLLGSLGQSVLIDVAEGGGIGAWDLRASRLAPASVLRRRPEAYHRRLREAERARASGSPTDAGPANPHEELAAKEEGLSRFLVYDDYERRSGLVRVLSGDRELGGFVSGEWQLELAAAEEAVLSRSAEGLKVRKSITLTGDRLSPALTVGLEVRTESRLSGQLELEWNLNMLGGGGNPAAYYRWAGMEARHDEAGELAADDAVGLTFGNRSEGVEVRLSSQPAADVRWYPVETVSNSEAGFERVYQGSCVILRWPLELAAGASCQFSVTLAVTQSRDREAEERR
ncbi:MAG TPA: alpha-amylase/4-alpha-glucanotransferase domain-containing protein [Candidatus Limnocylindria bacterium]|nr:alpha-amylase/4-alpha-glucanotransferase domain-containing protein [Candidatus Limnocylindria bacterium]